MSPIAPPNLLDSYTAPKEILDEFRELADREDVDPLAKTASLSKVAARHSTRVAVQGQDAFHSEGTKATEGGYVTAMRLAQLEREETRVKAVIAARERQDSDMMDFDRTPRYPTSAAINGSLTRKRRWDAETTQDVATDPPKKRRSRWDATPADMGFGALTPIIMAPRKSMTDASLLDAKIDALLPSAGYIVARPPSGYTSGISTTQKLAATPVIHAGGFVIHDSSAIKGADLVPEVPTNIGDLSFFRPEDARYFSQILKEDTDESDLSVEELKERKILRLLLKIKNGTPPVRKAALRQITAKAREFGAAPLFNKILPLLMERTLEDQERHLLVKVIDRVLFQLDDLVRPFVHKILVVIQPLLIDQDYYARIEGREIISNLSKAAGLAHMISTMRPDIDHTDEYVRNTTARAFAVVATALGIPAVLPFIKAVCRSKKSWQARHTGIRIVQQIAIMVGCGVLPHLTNLVECIAPGLSDEQQKVRTMTALSIAALAEAAAPYGIESFGAVVELLWSGIRVHRGKGLAAFLKAVGFIVPLMDPEYASSFTKNAMHVLMREFNTSDEEMKKIVLKVVQQCVGTEGVTSDYVRQDVVPQFFKAFWTRRIALDRRNYKQVVCTTVELSKKAGAVEVVEQIVDGLKDDSEPYRKMVMETITTVIARLGVSGIDTRTEARLVDGVLYAFQDQATEDDVMLDGFGTVVNALGIRVKPYLTQIVSTILWRLNNKSAKVRQQAADLTKRLAIVIALCGEDQLLSKLGLVLFEQLGEEYPDTLGSIVGALGAIANTVGMTQMNPPVKDLLSRMTPILRNRHEKVQEAAINLVGRVADRGAEFVSAREWMRICFELLDLLKARKKNIRRAAVNTFGYIAKSIGPQDVISVLLTNLRVQERQSRVCSTIALAIVAETCGPFTCIPAILNEYRTAELNVRTGCLKALTYIFEYIGPQSAFYCDSVIMLLEDALTDRDAVHRQTASTIVKHLALGVAGMGCEDSMLHLTNLVWPNCFETSPHVLSAVMDAIEAMRVALGPGILLSYVLQGLFHPARKVREAYWRIYNVVYLGAEDALVPFYPDLGELGFGRQELQVFV